MTRWIFSLLLLSLVSCGHSQVEAVEVKEEAPQMSVLDSLGLDLEVAQNPKYRFQFVATSIKDGQVQKSVSYGTHQYYYPASLVKVPAALILLEILKENKIPLDANPVFDTVQACGSTRFVDICKNNKVSFRKMIQELLVASDNHYYNALYHFITPQEFNARLSDKGYAGVNVYRAFTGCDPIDQLRTYPCKVFRGNDTSPIHEKQATVMDSSILNEVYSFSEDRLFGSKHENRDGDIVDGPYDLNYHIEIPLEQIHRMMMVLYYPGQFSDTEQWNVRSEDLTFIQDVLGMYPSEIKTKKSLRNFDYKYVRNVEKTAEGRTFGKLGLSYGFASETVYLPSEAVGNGVLISYSVYVNSNDIVNDGEYDYETVARPFAEKLGEKIIDWHNQ